MTTKPMSFKAAAKELLRRADRPMSAKELTAQAIEEGGKGDAPWEKGTLLVDSCDARA